MGGKGRSSPPPPPEAIDPGESMGEYLFGKGFSNYQGVTDPRLQDRLLAAERRNRPEYTALELADIETMAFGRDGQEGLVQLLGRQAEESGEIQRRELQRQREADVGALEEFAPRAVEAFRAADPRSAALADAAQEQALGLFSEAGGQLSPERRRLAEQAARAGSLSRGRIGDESSIASEILNREQFRSGLRQEARQAGAGAFGMQRQMAGDLGSAILGRPSAAIGLGGQVLGQAQQGAAGQMGPQLFDPNVGINMALQQRSQDINYQGAMAQASAARSAGKSSMFGSILGGAASAIPFCWVAREVYGIENPKWLEFRYWMLNDAPSWFRNLYVKYGERIAKFISNKPRIKSIIRKWMNTKIK
jgi:hypothetical protein